MVTADIARSIPLALRNQRHHRHFPPLQEWDCSRGKVQDYSPIRISTGFLPHAPLPHAPPFLRARSVLSRPILRGTRSPDQEPLDCRFQRGWAWVPLGVPLPRPRLFLPWDRFFCDRFAWLPVAWRSGEKLP